MPKEMLEVELAGAKTNVARIESAIEAFDSAPENNVFSSVEIAGNVLEKRLLKKAFEDCEGAGNCGDPSYSQEFIVDGVHYVGTLKLEYRHDKTYYFIDEVSGLSFRNSTTAIRKRTDRPSGQLI